MGEPVEMAYHFVYKTDDHALCARIQSLADDRACWLGTAKFMQKELDKLKEL